MRLGKAFIDGDLLVAARIRQTAFAQEQSNQCGLAAGR